MANGFRIKTFDMLTASMVNWFAAAQTAVTDFNVGSVARTLLEAVASELTEVYYRIFDGLLAAQADAIYDSFDFPAGLAAAAGGTVLWQTTGLPVTTLTIPVGSQVAVPATSVTPQISFSVNEAAVIPAQTTLNGSISAGVLTLVLTSAVQVGAGDVLRVDSEQLAVTSVAGNTCTVTRGYNGTTAASHLTGAAIGVTMKAVPMTADRPGAAGNVGAATISLVTTPITGIASVTNPLPMVGGADAETEDARKKRFNAYISGLARGTKAAIEFGALTVPGCVKALAVDLDDDGTIPPGTVKLYIADSAGSMSTALQAAVLLAEEAYRPAGVQVVVANPTATLVAVTATLTVAPGFNATDLVNAVVQNLTAYIEALQPGDTLYLARLYQLIVDTNPAAVISTAITAPTGDTVAGVPAYSHLIRPGTLTITVP